MWRRLKRPMTAPLIFYSPLVLDWSGSKLSKSMSVKVGSYQYLQDAELDFMLKLARFLAVERGMEALYVVVTSWMAEPYRIFRSSSLECLHELLLRERGMRVSCGLPERHKGTA